MDALDVLRVRAVDVEVLTGRLRRLQNDGLSADVTREAIGETRPVAANENRDGSDNPEGRQLNRRVEIIVHEGA